MSGPDRKEQKAPPPGRMQMADLARLAGVSASTVSRALRGSELINADTRARIQELARRFHYTVNSAATNLRSGTNRTIAVVVPYEPERRQSFADPFFHGMIGSLADALTERGYDMLLVRLDADRLDAAAALVDGGRAAGIILIGQWRHHDQLNAMARRHLPMVVWGAHMPDQHYATIGGDNVEGGRLVAEHLLGQGRRRIAFLGDKGLPEVERRYQGFVEEHARRGIEHPAELDVSVPFLASAGRDAVRGLLAADIAFDAVFATSDLLAMSAIGALHEAGLKVPEQVAVVGYDDVELAAHVSPALSTVRQPLDVGGARLVESLLAMLAGEPVARDDLATTLVVRDSSRSG